MMNVVCLRTKKKKKTSYLSIWQVLEVDIFLELVGEVFPYHSFHNDHLWQFWALNMFPKGEKLKLMKIILSEKP